MNKKTNAVYRNTVEEGHVTDPTTGEVLRYYHTKTTRVHLNLETTAFTMIFDLVAISDLAKGVPLRILSRLVQNEMEFESNKLTISSGLRNKLSLQLGTHKNNISKAIQMLYAKDLVRPVEFDVWMVTPEFIWQGNLVKREEAFSEWQKLKKYNKAQTDEVIEDE